ncbi:thioredoxin domain-containing protein [Chryseobacterium sp. PCH239]|uniref:vitamin K epoxide reductase family protein n=1 Tax=Chryseobacterium sp. PCH239 TaxID=2825845 RepID=UPI001C113398|nr:vitamin K epoxide reductase family protein [Chryseobacterium sp. PCH239]QWT84558.1 thioredoxin domain-containing protein [Chryseobacterium sp. PCH239]
MLVLYASGIILSFLLTWYEVDNQNPFLKEVCSGGKKINCNAVLQAKGANFYGIEWSIIGLSYFTSGLLTILILGFNNPLILQVLGILSLFATCYIIYSLYYQYKIVKEWCILCLGVQGVLLAQAIAVLFYFNKDKNWLTVVDLEYAIPVVLLFALVTMGIIYIFPFVKKAKLGRLYEIRWKHMKTNPNVFFGLLAQQPKIQNYPDDIGIVLGNPEAENEIIKVCNPYCQPCAKAHPILEDIVKKNRQVKLRIIFSADDSEQDIKAKPVRHFMALAEFKSPQEIQHILDDWYISKEIGTDYETFANKYPLNEGLSRQGHKLNDMKIWCDEMKIQATPTFFINGYEMMDSYSVSELKDIFIY